MTITLEVDTTFAKPIERLREDLDMDATLNGIIDATKEPSLGDLIRMGSTVTEQAVGAFGDGVQACALSAAYIAAKANEVL